MKSLRAGRHSQHRANQEESSQEDKNHLAVAMRKSAKSFRNVEYTVDRDDCVPEAREVTLRVHNESSFTRKHEIPLNIERRKFGSRKYGVYSKNEFRYGVYRPKSKHGTYQRTSKVHEVYQIPGESTYAEALHCNERKETGCVDTMKLISDFPSPKCDIKRETSERPSFSKIQSLAENGQHIKQLNKDIDKFNKLIEENKQKSISLYEEVLGENIRGGTLQKEGETQPEVNSDINNEDFLNEILTNPKNETVNYKENESKLKDNVFPDEFLSKKEPVTEDTIEIKKTLSQILDPLEPSMHLDPIPPNESLACAIPKGADMKSKLNNDELESAWNEMLKSISGELSDEGRFTVISLGIPYHIKMARVCRGVSANSLYNLINNSRKA
eukprot:TRINITY_DN1052_c0_g6_i1.p1 TRINITY_DN1052_c0_g6~~TRINITY_DN1052_c0_g6_i1.p1  ORF type:complete len:385 (+),score=65.17 TRINITY_DN1052_c0_g6_i1:1011-2165(+)